MKCKKMKAIYFIMSRFRRYKLRSYIKQIVGLFRYFMGLLVFSWDKKNSLCFRSPKGPYPMTASRKFFFPMFDHFANFMPVATV